MEQKNLKAGNCVSLRIGDNVVVGHIQGMVAENLASIECDTSAFPFVDWRNNGNVLVPVKNILGLVDESKVTEAHKRSRAAIQLAEKENLLGSLSDLDKHYLKTVIAYAYIGAGD